MITPATYQSIQQQPPTLNFDVTPTQAQLAQLKIGQVVQARVIESDGTKATIVLHGVRLQATTHVAVAAGDVLYFSLRSLEPLVLQLHGMEFQTATPAVFVANVLRLLNISDDRLSMLIVSGLIQRNEMVSKRDVENIRRTLVGLRKGKLWTMSDNELLDIVFSLKGKNIPATDVNAELLHVAVRNKEIAERCTSLLELLKKAEIPSKLSLPIVEFFSKKESLTQKLHETIRGLGFDHEKNIVAWGTHNGKAADGIRPSLKWHLLNLHTYLLQFAAANERNEQLFDIVHSLILNIESQQLENVPTHKKLQPITVHIPIQLNGSLQTITITVLPQKHFSSKENKEQHEEFSFQCTLSLSELGTIVAHGRVSGKRISVTLSSEHEVGQTLLHEQRERLKQALTNIGFLVNSISAHAEAAIFPLTAKSINATA